MPGLLTRPVCIRHVNLERTETAVHRGPRHRRAALKAELRTAAAVGDRRRVAELEAVLGDDREPPPAAA